MSNCTIESLDLVIACIPFSSAVVAALVSAIVSLAISVFKIQKEQAAANARKKFETEERQAREAFEAKMLVHGHLATYTTEAWNRIRTRLEEASQQLTKTQSGLISLIDDGPNFDEWKMIRETANALDVFGDFQTTVNHFALPDEIAKASRELIGHMTKILLTLSPVQEVRQSMERKALLAPLKEYLEEISKNFLTLCRQFERNPQLFVNVKPPLH